MAMKVKIIKDDEGDFTFKLSDGDPWMTNLLRRTILGQVSALAIDKVTFYESKSYMFDEYIAHRIGLIPLKTAENTKDSEEIMFTLDVQGPGEVTSGDLKTKTKVRPVYDNIPIISLKEGQNMRLEAVARMGTPREHQKYQAGIASYSYDDPNEITFNVESFRNYPMAHDLVKIALRKIRAKAKDCSDSIKKVK